MREDCDEGALLRAICRVLILNKHTFAFLFRDGVVCALWHGHGPHVVVALVIVLCGCRFHLCIF